jgi:hypothetical protein
MKSGIPGKTENYVILMNNRIGITSIALLITMFILPGNLFARMPAGLQEGLEPGGPMMYFAGTIIVLKITLVFRFIITNRFNGKMK